MNPDRFTFDQQRLESLDRKTMQSRSAVQENGMPLGHFFENVPNLWCLALDHFLRAPNRVDIAEVFQPANNEWLEQDQRHLFGQTTLVELQFRPNHNHRTAGVIDPFA